MVNAYSSVGSTAPNWSLLAAPAYDQEVNYALRTMPTWRQLIDVHPVDQTAPGTSVTLNVLQEFTVLATTPIDEIIEPDSVSPPVPTQVTVTLNEYGNYSIQSNRLRQLSYATPSIELANLIAKNQLDTLDKLVQNVVDTGTHIVGLNSGVIKSEANSFSEALVAASDIGTSALTRTAVALLRRRKAVPKDGTSYFAVIHPDVAADLRGENAATAWIGPHAYGADTAAIYAGEIGTFQGARFIEIPDRVKTALDGVSSGKVYSTYFLGQQALVEAVGLGGEPQTVIGNIVDPLNRKFPIGWKALLGWAIYRAEAMQIMRSSSSLALI